MERKLLFTRQVAERTLSDIVSRCRLTKITEDKQIVCLGVVTFLLQLFIAVTALKAQERPGIPNVQALKDRVTGTVLDEKGEGLPGASVSIRSTGNKLLTDSAGRFEIAIAQADAIIVSYIGYKTQTVTVNRNSQPLVIHMEPDAVRMREVVISTGYQDIPQERATGSFATLDRKQLSRQASTDVISRIKGVAPSLLFDERSGKTRLSLRGRSTIFANDQPLIVVDNFPYDGDINNINPNDVESITILRDAAAASIWGARAGNGVIVITTRNGRLNRPMQIEFNSSFSMDQRPDVFYQPVISSSDFIEVEKTLFSKGFYDGDLANMLTSPPVSPVVDLLSRVRDGLLSEAEAEAQINSFRKQDFRHDLKKYFYRNGVRRQAGFSMDGGTNRSSYYFSAGFDKNTATRVGNDYSRLTVNARQTFRPAKFIQLAAGLTYAQDLRRIDNSLSDIFTGGPEGRALYPYARLADDSGTPQPVLKDYTSAFKEAAVSQGFLDWTYVPLEELNYADNTTKQSDTRIQGAAKFDLLDGLNAEFRYQFQRQIGDDVNYLHPNSYLVRDMVNRYSAVNGTTITRNIPNGGFLDKASRMLNAHNGRLQLNYNRTWTHHRISGLLGAEIREVKTTSYGSRYYGYDPNIGASVPVDHTTGYLLYPFGFGFIPSGENIGGTTDRFRSYFFTGSYSLKDKYTIYGSGRIDQSNFFGLNRNQRAVPLWSSGLKWNMSRENFYNVPALPVLALKASYGFNGNIDKSVTALTTAAFSTNLVNGMPGARIANPPNPELGWEKTAILNLEAEFGFKNDVVTGTISYYRKKGTDLIGNSPLDPTVGLEEYRGNVAGMSGHGVDVHLNSINLNKAFRWESSVQFSYTTDKVTRYDLESALAGYFFDASFEGSPFFMSPTVGRPLFGVYSTKWAGLDPQTGDPRGLLNGSPSADYAALSASLETIDDLVYHGRALPPVFGSVLNTFGYKGLTASFNIGYRFGYFFRRSSIDYGRLFHNWQGHGDFGKRWQKPGDELFTNVPSMPVDVNGARDNFYQRSEALIEPGDNVRLQDVNLSYVFDREKWVRLPVRALQLYVNVNNAGLLWTANKAGIDPDYPQMPLPMTLSVGFRTTL